MQWKQERLVEKEHNNDQEREHWVQPMITQPAGAASTPPDRGAAAGTKSEEGLQKTVEESLLPTIDKAKESLYQKLIEAPIDEVTRERLVQEYNDPSENTLHISRDLEVEIERHRLRTVKGRTMDLEWSGNLEKEQLAIEAQIKEEVKSSVNDLSSSTGENQCEPKPLSSHLGTSHGAHSSTGLQTRISHASSAAAQWERDRAEEMEHEKEREKKRALGLAGLSELCKDLKFCEAVSSDRKKWATASFDRKVRLWNSGTGWGVGQVLGSHTSWVVRVMFSEDGKKLASASCDGAVRLWHVDTGQAIGSASGGHSSAVYHLVFSPDGKKLASISYDAIQLWDVETGHISVTLRNRGNAVFHAAFSTDGKYMAMALFDRTVQLLDVQSGQAIGSAFEGHPNGVVHVECARYSYNDGVRLYMSPPSFRDVRICRYTCIVNTATGECMETPIPA